MMNRLLTFSLRYRFFTLVAILVVVRPAFGPLRT